MPANLIFFTLVTSQIEIRQALRMVNSLRQFGGDFSACPFWIFGSELDVPINELDNRTRFFPLETNDSLHLFQFGEVATACAQAENMAQGDAVLVWMDHTCLFAQPPQELQLDEQYDVAVRPVHLRNVGQKTTEQPNDFWTSIYKIIGEPAVHHSVRTFVEGEEIRAYFNFHSMAVKPQLGIFQKLAHLFEQMIADNLFLSSCFCDALHRLFLFQAIMSSLIENDISWERIRKLPESYNYPLHLHRHVPPVRRAKAISDLVTFTNEGKLIDFDALEIKMSEEFRSWYLSLNRIGGK